MIWKFTLKNTARIYSFFQIAVLGTYLSTTATSLYEKVGHNKLY